MQIYTKKLNYSVIYICIVSKTFELVRLTFTFTAELFINASLEYQLGSSLRL